MKNARYLIWRNKILSPYTRWKENVKNPSPSDTSVLPDFLGIGGHKCGSTWLYANLKSHPGLFLTDTKEVHYFDLHFHRSLKWYLKHFNQASPHQIKGEITPAYGIISPARIQHVHRLLPQAKVLFLLRNPVERAWSHALMAFCTRNGKKPEDIPDEQFLEHFTRYNSTVRTHYETIYTHWANVYGRERIWIGFYQDIAQQPRELLSSCFEFLGADTPTDWDRFPMNTYFNKGPEFPIRDHLKSALIKTYKPLMSEWEKLFGPRVREWDF